MNTEKVLINAKTLRANQTEAEQRLWYHLRAHRFMNLKFKRQKPMGRFIVDFVCVEQQLIIEIDGGQHAEQTEYDQHRDAWLRSQGYTVLRFWNHEVMQQLEGVLEQIRSTIALSPAPLPRVGEGSNGTTQSPYYFTSRTMISSDQSLCSNCSWSGLAGFSSVSLCFTHLST